MSELENSLALFLQDVFESRKAKNPRYSMRAFARDLGISSGWISDIFAGRRLPGKRLTVRIARSLKLNDEDAQKLQDLVKRLQQVKSEGGDLLKLTEDQIAIISDRENLVLLNLFNTKDFCSDINWMSARLGVPPATVRRSLDRLERIGLIVQENGQYKSLNHNVTTTHNTPSKAIREFHRQNLLYSIESLIRDDPAIRDITSMTVAIDPNKLDEARSLIRQFRRKLASYLEGESKAEVYHLNIQLVPATIVKQGKGER